MTRDAFIDVIWEKAKIGGKRRMTASPLFVMYFSLTIF